MNNAPLTILNRAFVRIYRSLGQYVRTAAMVFDVGGDVLPGLIQRQAADAQRLGELVFDRQGSLATGGFPMEYGAIHFSTVSHLVPEWERQQRDVVAGIESDRAALGDAEPESASLLDDIVAHERQILHELERLAKPMTVRG